MANILEEIFKSDAVSAGREFHLKVFPKINRNFCSIINLISGSTSTISINNGINTFTGGTPQFPSVNVTGLSIDNISVSGSGYFNSISATTFFSGSTELSLLFGGAGSGITTGYTTGVGPTIFKQVSGNSILFRSLSAGTSISITQENDHITINAHLTGGTFGPFFCLRSNGYLITTGDTQEVLDVVTGLTTNTTNIIESYVTANKDDNETGIWKRVIHVNNNLGVITIIKVLSEIDSQQGGLTPNSVDYVINGSDIDIKVTGISATTYTWKSHYEVIDKGASLGQITGVVGIDNGINTFTGGTPQFPSVNVTGLSIDNISVSGNSYFNSISASTIFSGGTDLYDIFGQGTIYTGHTPSEGSSVFKQVSGGTILFRNLSAGTSINLTQDNNYITINAETSSLRSNGSIITTGATQEILDIITGLTINTTNIIESYITANKDNDENGIWKRVICVNNNLGTITIVKVLSEIDFQQGGLFPSSVDYSINGSNIDIKVTGVSSNTYSWRSHYEVIGEGAYLGGATSAYPYNTANFEVIEVVSDYNIQTGNTVVGANTLNSLSPILLMLPDSISTGQKTFFIKDSGANSSIYNIITSASTTDTIVDSMTGQTSKTISSNGGSFQITNTGTGVWWII